MRKSVVLITGAGGEIGHGLIDRLAETGRHDVVTLDLRPLEAAVARQVQQQFVGSILDGSLLERILSEYEVELVFHLAALLSTRSEFTPITAHQVNVEGTLHLLEFAQKEGESHGRPVVFIYPSSIAAYGFPDLEAKRARGPGEGGRRQSTPSPCTAATSSTASTWAATTRATTSSCAAESLSGRRGLPLRALPRPHLRR